MMEVIFRGRAPYPSRIKIGNHFDNNVEMVRFDVPKLKGGKAFLHLCCGSYTDIVALSDAGMYTVSRGLTQVSGVARAYVQILADGDAVWNSDVVEMQVGDLPDDGPQIEQAYPTAIESALRAAAETHADREEVEALHTAVERALDTVEGAAGAEEARREAEAARAAAFSGWKSELDGKAVIDDAVVGPGAWSSRRIVDALCPELTLSGEAVQGRFVPGYPLDVKAYIEAKREGAGDPSPGNVRPLVGTARVEVSTGGEDAQTNPGHRTTHAAALPETCYGGYIDWARGKYVRTHEYFLLPVEEMDNTDEYPGWRSVANLVETVGADWNNAIPNARTSIGNNIRANTKGSGVLFFMKYDLENMTQTEFKAAHPGLRVQVVLPRLTPVECDLPGLPALLALDGVTTVMSGTGRVEVTGRADPAAAIAALTARVAALEGAVTSL